jgi:hypothetical protein
VPKGTTADKHLAKEAIVTANNMTDGESWPPAERMLTWIVENGGEVGPRHVIAHLPLFTSVHPAVL